MCSNLKVKSLNFKEKVLWSMLYAKFLNIYSCTAIYLKRIEVLTYLLMTSYYNFSSSSMSSHFTKTTKEVTTPTTQTTTTIMNERYIVNLPSPCDTNRSILTYLFRL